MRAGLAGLAIDALFIVTACGGSGASDVADASVREAGTASGGEDGGPSDDATIATADGSAGHDAAVDGSTDAGAGDAGAVPYAGQIATLVCDIKRPLAGMDAPLTTDNYQVVLDALHTKVGCNAIRIYIDPSIADPGTYPALYVSVLTYARSQLGLKVYANPLATGTFGKTNADYAAWVAEYANAMQPDYLGPFNESGLGVTNLEDIASRVAAQLTYAPELVGPDAQHVESTLALLDASGTLASSFDILGSHNAVDDEGANSAAWTSLAGLARGKTWSTENPQSWSDVNADGGQIGVSAVVSAPIQGLVLYEAFPSCVGADGTLTATGRALVAGLIPP